MINRKKLKIAAIAAAVTAAGIVLLSVKGTSPISSVSEIEDEESSVLSGAEDETEGAEITDEEASQETPSEQIYVYVCGAVIDPGVYTLAAGARVYEAVEAAGGLSDDAAADYVNLAAELSDGQQLYIPTLTEALEEGLTAGSDNSSLSDEDEDGLININTATSEELQALPGIGEAKAAAIISYREDNGSFSSIEDITNVSGIGESTFENIKDYITV